MSDGHGSSPETPPPGWSPEQPPPYGAPQASPWTAPGSGQQQLPYGQPYGTQPPQQPYGAQQQQQYQQQPPPPPGYGNMPPHPHMALRPGIIPLRPLGLGDILDGTIKFIRSNPKAVLGLSALAAGIAAVPAAVGQALATKSMGSLMESSTTGNLTDMYSGLIASYSATGISLIISFIVTTVLTGMLTRILGRSVFGGKITPGEAWHLVKGRVPALFGVVALTGLIMLAPMVPIVAILVAMAFGGAEAMPVIGVGLLLMLAYVVYVLFFNTRFAFASVAAVLEGLGPIEAMKRSWRLVTGDFWRVLGILLLTGLMAAIFSYIISIPFGIVAAAMGLAGSTTAGAAVSGVAVALGSTIAAMITYPFQAGVAGLLYADRRMRSEAFDLVLQTAALEQQRQGWVHSSADDLWHPSNSARS
ncbi:hypothetical protein OIE66_34275 [Nonomuraea sp. NBC_01738]|uniref:hypothetical protein n=1 Tax=Nonomuraea sp. NBC_01738 TaxID=2976003 RepID=UPI002E0FE68D|nr:hypothetical protein OIE66_34275 [Nonomuraea sp. NBC_01738]